jgi:hypothetical protein
VTCLVPRVARVGEATRRASIVRQGAPQPPSHSRRITERPNKGMKQTKPAQAMELRSLSPVFCGHLRERAHGMTDGLRESGGDARPHVCGALVVLCLTTACHSLQKTATVSVLIETADYKQGAPCSLSLDPTTADTTWQWKSPAGLKSGGLVVWFPEIGFFESWPTRFKASLACDGYQAWEGTAASESAFRPTISIHAVIKPSPRT